MVTGVSVRQFFRSSTIQGRVVHALLMREVLTRFGRHNIGFLWMMVEPMLFTLGVAALWSLVKALHGSNLPIAAFALTGYSTVLLWRNMPARSIGAIEPNLSLMYHRNVKLIDVYLARLLLEGAGASMSFVVLSVVFIAVGLIQPPEDVFKVLMGWFMVAWFGMALAIFLGALSYESELIEKLWHPVSYIIFPLSGAAFLVDALPSEGQQAVLFLPMVHGAEWVRDGYFGSHFHAHYDPAYFIVVNLLLTLLAIAKLRKVSREITPE